MLVRLLYPVLFGILCLWQNRDNNYMQYIIFDIDGTLADTKEVEDKCFMRAFETTFGISIWDQKWETLTHVTDWGITKEIIERNFGRKPRTDEYERMIANFVANLHEEKAIDASQFNEVAGARDFFCQLQAIEGFQLGIATGSWSKSAIMKLDAIGIELNGVCFSNSDHHISREAIMQDVIDQLHARSPEPPDQIVYLGDGVWDFKACQNLGIRFIGIDTRNDGKLKGLGARTVYQNFEEKEQLLRELVLGS